MQTNTAIIIEDQQLQRRFEKLLKLTGDLTPAMDEIGQRYDRSVLENFRGQHSPDGTPWKRLSKTTLMIGLGKKGRTGKRGLTSKGRTYLMGKKILFESGDMVGRLHYQASTKSMTYGGTGLPYFRIHQLGGMAGRGRKVKIPAREYLAVNRGKQLDLAPKDRDMMIDVLDRHIEEAQR